MADDNAKEPGKNGARARARWRQADVRRALAAAEQAGLGTYRVEIAPDGTISIIVGAPSDSAPGPGLYDDLQGP